MIYIISGQIEIGKTTALLRWTVGRTDIFGVLTPRKKNDYRYILDVSTKECFPMQTSILSADSISVGRYYFLKEAFIIGNDIVNKALRCINYGFIIIDELGKLELNSEGFHESISRALTKTVKNKELHLILIIRTTLLYQALEKYQIKDYQLIIINDLNKT